VAEAHEAIDFMLVDNTLGVAHNDGAMAAVPRVVIEEFLEGEEASFIVMVRWQERAAPGHEPGPQALAGWRPGPQHRRHGCLFARTGGHRRMCMRKAMREIILPTVRAWKPTAFRSPAFCTPG